MPCHAMLLCGLTSFWALIAGQISSLFSSHFPPIPAFVPLIMSDAGKSNNPRMQSGLEVALSSTPEVIIPPNIHYEDKYYHRIGERKTLPCPPQQEKQERGPSALQRRICGSIKISWLLVIVALLSLALALGGGLGGGLAARHKQRATNPVAYVRKVPSLGILTYLGYSTRYVVSNQTYTATARPTNITALPTTISSTASDSSPMPTAPYLSSPACPSANAQTYTATKKPTSDLQSEYQVNTTAFVYQIFCNTNFLDVGPVIDLQAILNVTSLRACIDACALYSWQTRPSLFPSWACTGLAWANPLYNQAREVNVCVLKGNVTLSSSSGSGSYPGWDGSVLVRY